MKKLRVCVLLLAVAFSFLSVTPQVTTWTAIGDSITYLNNHLDETGNRVTKGYLTRVTEQLPNIKYINQGHNGWSIVGIAREIEKLGIQKSDIYSVFLGTNDWGQGLPLGTFDDYKNNTGLKTSYGAYRVIIDKIKSLNPNARIILVTPLQREDFVYVADKHNYAAGSYKANKGQQLSQFADAVIQIGAYEHLDVVDLYYKSGIKLSNTVKFKRVKDPQTGEYKNFKFPDFQGIPFNPDTDEYPYPAEAIDNTYDGLHPSDKGNKKIAGMIVKLFKTNKR